MQGNKQNKKQTGFNPQTSSLKISDLTKNDSFELNLAQNDKKVGQKYFSADFTSFWDSLTHFSPVSHFNTP